MQVVSRKVAVLAGQKHYFTGKPCKHGHVDQRYTNGGCCMECARITARKWRDANLEVARRKNREWAANNPEKLRQNDWRRLNLPEATRSEPACCELCGKLQKSALHLDHDHLTGEFRGWLCRGCNLGLGMLGDTLESVLRAAVYLRRT